LFGLSAGDRNCPEVNDSLFICEVESDLFPVGRQSRVLYVSPGVEEEMVSAFLQRDGPHAPMILAVESKCDLVSIGKPARNISVGCGRRSIVAVGIRDPDAHAPAL